MADDRGIESTSVDPRTAPEGGISALENSEIDAAKAGATPEQIQAAQRKTSKLEENAPKPKKPSANVTFSDGTTATIEGKDRAHIIETFQLHETSLKANKLAGEAQAKRLATADAFQQSIITTPIGARPLPSQEVVQHVDPFTGAPIQGMPMDPTIQSDNEGALHGQAWDAGVDVRRGTGISDSFAIGLTNVKDPQLQLLVLQKSARKRLTDAGHAAGLDMNPIYRDPNTDKIMIATPVLPEDVEKWGEDPANVGGVRMVMANDLGPSLGDVVEFLPDAPVMAAEIAAGVGALAVTKSPQAALALSTAATGFLNTWNTPLKNAVLKQVYGLTQEEIDKYSDPNEALKASAFAMSAEFGMGQLLYVANAAKRANPKRNMFTEEDLPFLISKAEEVGQVLKGVEKWTGKLTLSDETMAASVGVGTKEGRGAGLAVFSSEAASKLGIANKRAAAATDLRSRLQVLDGFVSMTNEAVTEASDPAALAKMYRDGMLFKNKDGLIEPPAGAATQQRVADVESGLRGKADLDDVGTTLAQSEADAARALSVQDRALAKIDNNMTTMTPDELLAATDDSMGQAIKDAQQSWGIVDEILEFDDTMKAAGIVLRQTPHSATSKAINKIEREGLNNLSAKLGAKDTKFADDLAALRNPESGTLDIKSLQRLDSQLSHELRSMDRPGADSLGYDRHQIQELQRAINTQIQNADWIRSSTGKVVPALKKRGLNALKVANDATHFKSVMAQKKSIRNLTSVEPTFVEVDGVMRKTGSFEFNNMAGEALDKIMKDPQLMKNIVDVTRQNPQVKSALSEEMLSMYKRQVTPDGQAWTQAGHNRFMQQYGDHMDIVFGPEHAAKVSNLETLGSTVSALANRNARLEAVFAGRFGKDFLVEGGLNADHFVGHVMSSSNMNSKQLRNMMDEVKRIDPDLHTALKAETGNYIVDRIATGALLSGDGKAMDTLMKEVSPRLSAIMGEQYVKDFREFRNVLDMFRRADQASGVSGIPSQASWLAITRSMLGPLSKKQRFLTSYNRIQKSFGAQRTLEIMSDPDQLHKLVRLSKISPTTMVGAGIVAELGIREHLRPEDSERLDEMPDTLPTTEGLKGYMMKIRAAQDAGRRVRDGTQK